jgi:YggT family protein
MDVILRYVSLLTTVLTFAIFARAILSWFPNASQGNNPIVALLYQITEPILAPIRNILAGFGLRTIDLSPMVAIFALYAIQRIIESAVR